MNARQAACIGGTRSGGFAALLLALLAGAWAGGAALHPGSPAPTTAPFRAPPVTTGRNVLVDHLAARRPRREDARMRTAARSAGYGALVVAAFAAAWTAGAPSGPLPGPSHRGSWSHPGGWPRAHAAVGAPVPCRSRPAPPSRVAEVDGYQVRLDGDLVVGAPSQVFVTVSRDGAPVTDLEPSTTGSAGSRRCTRRPRPRPRSPGRGAAGATDRAGPGIAFTAEVPTAGTYRLFLDFRHGGARHTAVFTVATGSTG